jgi:hypothetical protein
LADTDGNRRTVADTAWQPLITNPPYPEHPSGLSAFGGAATSSLQDFFGTDEMVFGTTAAGVTRSYTRFSQAADEIVDARVWSGIHFRFADEQGVAIGRRVGRWRQQHFFGPECRHDGHGWEDDGHDWSDDGHDGDDREED